MSNKFRIITLTLFILMLIGSSNAQQVNNPKEKSAADSMMIKAERFAKNGRPNQAIELLEDARSIYYEGHYWESYVENLLKNINYLDSNVAPFKRVTLINEAISITNQNLSKDHQLLVDTYRLQAEYFIDGEKLDSAQMSITEAIRIGNKTNSWEELAWSYMVNAVINYYNSDFLTMEISIDSSLILAENKIEDPLDHFAYINTLQSILFESTGNYEKAFLSSENTLKWFRKKTNLRQIDSLGLANAYNTHAAINYERGDYTNAINHYKVALNLHHLLQSDNNTIIKINNNISLSYKRQTDWKQRDSYLSNSESLLPRQPDQNNFKEWIRTHQFRASDCINQKNYNRALTILNNILPISQKYQFNEEWIQKALGIAYSELNNHSKAQFHLKSALKLMQNLYGDRHPNLANMYKDIGDSFDNQNNHLAALNSYQLALIALSTNFNDSLMYSNPPLEDVNSLTELLIVLKAKGQLLQKISQNNQKYEELALNTFRAASDCIDLIRQRHDSNEAKLLLSTHAKPIYAGSIELLHRKYQKENKKDLLEEAFTYVEKSRSLLLLEMIRSSNAQKEFKNGINNTDTLFYSLLEKGKRIKSELLFFEQKLSKLKKLDSDPNSIIITNFKSATSRLYQEEIDWKSKMKEQYPAYFDLQYDPNTIDLLDIQSKLLGPKEVLFEYFISKTSVFLFIISNEHTEFIKLNNSNFLEAEKELFQSNLSDIATFWNNPRKAFSNYNHASFKLYQSLHLHFLDSLPGEISKLIIVPDDFLNDLPFDALNTHLLDESNPNFGKLPYLLNDYALHYGYSSSLLLTNKNRRFTVPSNVQCLAMAPSYIEQKASSSLPLNNTRIGTEPLRGTAEELKNMEKYFSGHYELGDEATERLFKKKASEFGILHLAMHGQADFNNPDFAHLKFTNTRKSLSSHEEDNLLYHYEISNMSLTAQLAVLSACETGRGKYEEGEGVFSLARSFMYAGVPSIVMSLWNIHDESTSRLIPIFYRNLSLNMDKDLALQNAKIEYLNKSEIQYRHPYYWSGVILLGDNQALKRTPKKKWRLLLLLGLLIPILFYRKSISLFS